MIRSLVLFTHVVGVLARLRLSLRIRVAFGLAIVFLMIAKPGAGESLLVLVLASIATIATSLSRRPTPSTAVQGYR